MSLNAGRVNQAVGASCSDGSAAGGFNCGLGQGAADCTNGYNLTSVPACLPLGSTADNRCDIGDGAVPACYYQGNAATLLCGTGSGFADNLLKKF